MQEAPPTDRASARPLADGLEAPERNWAAATVITGIVMSALDMTMISVALPDIARDLNISAGMVVWAVMANMLAIVVSLLPFSAVAERIGFRRMYATGLTVFMVSALVCAFSTTFAGLIVGRVFQGFGASMLMCLFGGLVRNIYPMRMMGFGIGLNAVFTGLMSVLGPTIGAFILEVATWHWIFAIHIPLGIATYFGVRFLPDISRRKGSFDWWACGLSIVMFGAVIVGLDALAQVPLQALGWLAVGIVTGIILVHRSRGQTAPFVPVDLLRISPVAFAAGASAFAFAAQMAAFVALPFYFLNVLGLGYTDTGLLLGAWSIGIAFMAPVAGVLTGRFKVALLCAIGASAMIVAMAVVILLPAGINVWLTAAAMLLGGVGFGFFQTPNNHALLTGAPRHRSAAVGALQATVRVFGQSFGTALVAIGFNLGGTNGAVVGVGMAMLCAAAALILNVVRYFSPVPDSEI